MLSTWQPSSSRFEGWCGEYDVTDAARLVPHREEAEDAVETSRPRSWVRNRSATTSWALRFGQALAR